MKLFVTELHRFSDYDYDNDNCFAFASLTTSGCRFQPFHYPQLARIFHEFMR